MAEKSQQSSLKKLLIIGVPVIAILAFMPSGNANKGEVSKGAGLLGKVGAAKPTKKSVNDLITDADIKAKPEDFEKVPASLKNSFIPGVTKGSAVPVAKNILRPEFTGGEAAWTYTGNMTVDGVPNALLENTSSGQGVFLRPGQRWKTLRLVSVHEDHIVVEGSNGQTQQVYFEDLTAVAEAPLSPLPVAVPAGQQGGTQPNNNGQGNGRRNRQANNQFAEAGNLAGPIGANGSDPSLDSQDQTNNNRRNRNRRNNENSFN